MGSHYQDIAQSYEEAFFYSSKDYQSWVLSHCIVHLGLPDEDARIVDLGGGTGNFTQALAEASRARRRALCVDPFPDMLDMARGRPGIDTMLMKAEDFAGLPPEQMAYSHVLLKEVVHHLPRGELPALYTGLACQLAPGGCALTITRPQEVDYPLFPLARKIWREHQPPAEELAAAMRGASLEVEVHSHDYQASLPKATWLGMMRSRFWSTFSHCSDEELETGIAEVALQHEHSGTVHFVDRLLFLVATKPAEGSSARQQQQQAQLQSGSSDTPQQAQLQSGSSNMPQQAQLQLAVAAVDGQWR